MAKENSGWGYDRIVGALANLGHEVSDETIANVLKRHGIAPALKRSQTTTWTEFIQSHMAVLAGIDFFSVKVLTWRGVGDRLRFVLPSPGESPCKLGRDDATS
jgi:putative transposase